MTTPQKAFLTAGIIVQSLIVVDVIGIASEMVEKPRHFFSGGRDHVAYDSTYVVRSPIGILTAGLDRWNGSKKAIHTRFYWYSGINVGVTLLMLVIWRRKNTADA